METKTIKIDRPFITLGQLLKEEGIIPTGGAAKWFLSEHSVRINDELEDRRGRKLYPEDVVIIPEHEPIMIKGK
ncbi:S4 domain-containing protein YaaA [Lactobacillaceae bacterium 24-114]